MTLFNTPTDQPDLSFETYCTSQARTGLDQTLILDILVTSLRSVI